jgi:hypothetical protein
MRSNTILAAPVLATVALANPLTLRREVLGPCPPINSDQCFEARVGYYNDKDCTDLVGGFCVNGIAGEGGDCSPPASGTSYCEQAGVPDTTPYWAKILSVAPGLDQLQIVYTQDQSCPPSGPGAVFATLINNGACVQLNKGGDVVGLSVFPSGGSGLAKRNATLSQGLKRDGAGCSGFKIESSQPSESPSQQVSEIVDCTNGSDNNACSITREKQHTTSVTTSYTLSVGGSVGFLGEEATFEATFGMEYTQEETSGIQEMLTVENGQKGYLSVYSAATLFHGTFTGCNSGDAEQPGDVLAIKKNGLTYAVINTAA